MKKLLPLTLSLLLLLSACGGSSAKTYDPQAAAQALVDAEAFSVPLEELDASLLYDFQGYGIDADKLTTSLALSASGYAEQVSVTLWKTEDDAKAATDAFDEYLLDMEETYRSYAPLESDKLSHAIVSRRGTSVLLVVPADVNAAQKAVDTLETK